MLEREVLKSTKYEILYKEADKFITFNDGDPELRPVTLRLPDPPDIHYIDGYGLPPEQQKFQYFPELPRLDLLARRALEQAQQDRKHEGKMTAYLQIKNFWKMLQDDAENYKWEIDMIKKAHWYLLHGYWCFIFGKPTWIPPKHFFYLSFYYAKKVQGNRVDYRDEDRIVRIWEHYCDTTTETFKDLDNEGYAVPNEDGQYEMVDVGSRTCVGSLHPKRRRKGISMSGGSDCIYVTTRGRERTGVIQADLGKSAEDIYNDFVVASWNNLKIWLKPINTGEQNPSQKIAFSPPSSVVGERSLSSEIIWNDSAKEGVNDRRKIHYLLNDESAKVSLYDVEKRWKIDRLTLMQGADIHGVCRNPSTVEEMAAGGEYYMKMFKESDFYRREEMGMTYSYLYRLFRPVWQGWEGFIDEWGYSVVDTPTEAQLKNPPPRSRYHILNMGSLQYWEQKYDRMLADPNEQANYRIEIRKHPMVSSDCWRGSSGDMGWNYLIIDQALSAIRSAARSETTRGDFVRQGVKSEWRPHDKGKFVVSNLFIQSANQSCIGNQIWDEKKNAFVNTRRPLYPSVFTAGGDPFEYDANQSTKSKGFKLSKGGGAVYHNPDPQESELPIRDWESAQLVCYYENKTSTIFEYAEDMLAMCIWYGALFNLENNKKRVIEYFIDEGFGGYLWRGQEPNGTFRKDFGTHANVGTKSDMLNMVRDFIETRAHKCKIKEFLSQARDMTDPKQLTHKDGLAACGWAIYGSKSSYGKAVQRTSSIGDFDFSDMYGKPTRY